MLTYRICLGTGLALALGTTAHAAQSYDASMAGWHPLVTMWGGDAHAAVGTLERINHAFNAFLHHYELDEATETFIDKALDEFEDFDLKGFYKLLPDERNGQRELNVKGTLAGNRYLIARVEPGTTYEVGMQGPRSGLADLSLLLHARPHESDEHDTLLVGGRFGLGVGPLSYRALVDAQRDLLRIVTTGSATEGQASVPTSGLARAAIRETNPGLGDEDVAALALLFDAYPTLARALTDVGRVEDVKAADRGGSYHHITARMRAEPERLRKKYPAFAKHAERLSDVLHANLRVVDDKERNLVRLSVDSEKLQLTIECYVRDGLVLPFDDSGVYEAEPLDLLAGLEHPKVLIDARVNMLGIVVTTKALRVDARYAPHDSHLLADASVTRMPNIKVEGRALGLFAPGFLDLFIPSNIQGITEEFFRVAVKGNQGKGVKLHAELGAKAPGAPGVVAASASAEIMNTFLVKLAGGLVTDRLMMSDKAEREAIRLAAELHDAFRKDLAAFKQHVGSAAAARE